MEMVKEIKHIGHRYGDYGESIDEFELDGQTCFVYEECVDYLLDGDTVNFAAFISNDSCKQLHIADPENLDFDPETSDDFVGYISYEQYVEINLYLEGRL